MQMGRMPLQSLLVKISICDTNGVSFCMHFRLKRTFFLKKKKLFQEVPLFQCFPLWWQWYWILLTQRRPRLKCIYTDYHTATYEVCIVLITVPNLICVAHTVFSINFLTCSLTWNKGWPWENNNLSRNLAKSWAYSSGSLTLKREPKMDLNTCTTCYPKS